MSNGSMSNGSQISRIFRWRDHMAWDKYHEGNDEGFHMAHKLLLEPRLGDYHAANMHLLLTKSDDFPVHHGQEAVRLYTELINKVTTEDQIAYLQKKKDQAQEWLADAEQREAKEKERWAGMTGEEIVNAKMAEAMATLRQYEEEHEHDEEQEDEYEEQQEDTQEGEGRPKGRYNSGFKNSGI